MKVLKIKKNDNKKLFKVKSVTNKEFSKLIDKYYKIKTLAEHLETERQALRTLIIYLMEERGINNFDIGKYYCELYTISQTRLNLEEMRKVLPKEQLELFEIKLQTKALKIIPKNEEEVVKQVIKEYPQVFRGA